MTLRPYVERYWRWRTGPGERVTLAPLLPGTGADFLFHCGSGHVAVTGGPPSRSQLICVRKKPVELGDTHPDFFAIRFRAGMLRHLCHVALPELADSGASAAELWGAPGRELGERIGEATTLDAQARIADAFLLERLGSRSRDERWLDAAIGALYAGRGQVRLDALALDLGITPRQLQRRFKAALGVTPKRFARMARLQGTVRELVLASSIDYAPTALRAGYFDQAHFIHEFRALTGLRPREFLLATRGRSHFYNRSLGEARIPSGS